MSRSTGKTKPRKTTVVLAGVLVLLVLFALAVFVIRPAYRHYYVTHKEYPVYGGVTQDLKDCDLYKDMQSGKSFCFLGDSVTSGYEINNSPGYQPLVPYIKGNISNISRGGWMVHHLIEQADNIPAADVYVIAIGVNDVVFPWGKYAAQTPEEYVNRLDKLAGIIRVKSPDAKIYFITPWTLTGKFTQYEERGEQFRAALSKWCSSSGFECINPHPYISSVLKEKGENGYLLSGIHPDNPKGIGLYCYAVLKADHERL